MNNISSRKNLPLVNVNFDDIKVSTRTFTASTNLLIDIDSLATRIPVLASFDPSLPPPRGTIGSVNYLGDVRGYNPKPKKTGKRWFRNSFTVVVYLDKLVNFKVCKNGTFQITGALHFKHASESIRSIWSWLKNHDEVAFSRGKRLECLIVPAMRNLDFSLGIKVNRELFDRFIHDSASQYHCLLETSFGYTGLNVKKKITRPIEKLEILKIIVDDDSDQEWKGTTTTYSEYLDILPEKIREQKLKHVRYNTFLIFHSGKIIQSGLSSNFMRDDFNEFCELVNDAYVAGAIEERLDPTPLSEDFCKKFSKKKSKAKSH